MSFKLNRKPFAVFVVGIILFVLLVRDSVHAMHVMDKQELPEPMSIAPFTALGLVIILALMLIRDTAHYLVARAFGLTDARIMFDLFPHLAVSGETTLPRGKAIMLALTRSLVDILAMIGFFVAISMTKPATLVSPFSILVQFGIVSIGSMLLPSIRHDSRLLFDALRGKTGHIEEDRA